MIVFTTCPAPLNPSPTVEILHQGKGFSPGNDLSSPLGIFFDALHNECYVTDTGNHQIIVYNDQGMPLYRFYHHVVDGGRRQLGEPKSVVVDARGRIFVTDAAARYLDVLDHLGRQIRMIEPPADMCDASERFDRLALGPDGKVYATITCRKDRVVAVVGDDLTVERTLRLQPAQEGDLCPSGLSVDAEGKIYLTDPCAPLMVQIYDADGTYLMGFGAHDAGFENFSFPAGIAVMGNGNIWVVDAIRQVASCFNMDGQFLNYIGGKGDGPGGFNYPSSLATDGKDRLFVLERAGERYQCFRITADEAPEPENK